MRQSRTSLWGIDPSKAEQLLQEAEVEEAVRARIAAKRQQRAQQAMKPRTNSTAEVLVTIAGASLFASIALRVLGLKRAAAVFAYGTPAALVAAMIDVLRHTRTPARAKPERSLERSAR